MPSPIAKATLGHSTIVPLCCRPMYASTTNACEGKVGICSEGTKSLRDWYCFFCLPQCSHPSFVAHSKNKKQKMQISKIIFLMINIYVTVLVLTNKRNLFFEPGEYCFYSELLYEISRCKVGI